MISHSQSIGAKGAQAKHDKLRLLLQSKKIKLQCVRKSSIFTKPFLTSRPTLSPSSKALPYHLNQLESWKSIMESIRTPLAHHRPSYIDFFLTSKVNYVPKSERQLNSIYSTVYNWKRRFQKYEQSQYSYQMPKLDLLKPYSKHSLPKMKKTNTVILYKFNKLKKSDGLFS